jgi:hypothetical protein
MKCCVQLIYSCKLIFFLLCYKPFHKNTIIEQYGNKKVNCNLKVVSIINSPIPLIQKTNKHLQRTRLPKPKDGPMSTLKNNIVKKF